MLHLTPFSPNSSIHSLCPPFFFSRCNAVCCAESFACILPILPPTIRKRFKGPPGYLATNFPCRSYREKGETSSKPYWDRPSISCRRVFCSFLYFPTILFEFLSISLHGVVLFSFSSFLLEIRFDKGVLELSSKYWSIWHDRMYTQARIYS